MARCDFWRRVERGRERRQEIAGRQDLDVVAAQPLAVRQDPAQIAIEDRVRRAAGARLRFGRIGLRRRVSLRARVRPSPPSLVGTRRGVVLGVAGTGRRVAIAGIRAAGEQAHDVADTDAAFGPGAVNARDVEIELPHEPANGRAQRIVRSAANGFPAPHRRGPARRPFAGKRNPAPHRAASSSFEDMPQGSRDRE